MRAEGTLLDAVGRAKHSLISARASSGAVTVHGECPIAGCGAITVATVHPDTTSVTCSGCGTAFDV